MISLRPYQEDVRAEVSAVMAQGIKRILVVMPTGAGKTRVAAYMSGTSIDRKIFPVWFVVHRRELMHQTAIAFADAGIDVGTVASGRDLQPWRKAQIVLLPSLPGRLHALPPPRVIIPDEAHHSCARSHASLLNQFPDAWKIGLTATPERLDRKGLIDHFDRIVEGPSMRWLIDNGYLANYRIFAPPSVDVSQVHTTAGDFNKRELEDALSKSTIIGDAVREYQKHAHGKRTIIRSLSRDDSRQVAERFSEAGYRSAHIDGTTLDGDRTRLFQMFQNGEIDILSNVELFSEGIDIPGVECVMDLRPTKSLTMWLQFCGRALRVSEGKSEAIIIDHAGNLERHGFPDDEREWSLEGKKKREQKKIFTCKVCFGAFAESFTICPECGAINHHVSQGRGSPQKLDGELVEIDREEVRRRKYDPARQRARSLDDLKRYAREKGYKSTWADHVWKARQLKQQGAQ